MVTASHMAIQIRRDNPCATLQQIGDRLGISRERVRQVLVAASLPTHHYKQKHQVACLQCGRTTTHRRYCSMKCRYEYTHIWLECPQCHKMFRRPQTGLIHHPTEQNYCSRQCLGGHLGRTYGWKTPGNPGYQYTGIVTQPERAEVDVNYRAISLLYRAIRELSPDATNDDIMAWLREAEW